MSSSPLGAPSGSLEFFESEAGCLGADSEGTTMGSEGCMTDVDSLKSETQKRSASTELLALGAGFGSSSNSCLIILTVDALGLVFPSSFLSGTIYFLFWQFPIIIEKYLLTISTKHHYLEF